MQPHYDPDKGDLRKTIEKNQYLPDNRALTLAALASLIYETLCQIYSKNVDQFIKVRDLDGAIYDLLPDVYDDFEAGKLYNQLIGKLDRELLGENDTINDWINKAADAAGAM